MWMLFEPIYESVLINFTQRYSFLGHAVTETHLLRAHVDFSHSVSDSRPYTTDLY